MVPGWIAIAAWLAGWTVLAWISLGLLKGVRPGEMVPLWLKTDGTAAWFVSPVAAAAIVPVCAVVAGGVTIAVSMTAGQGRAPLGNVLLAGLFVLTHAVNCRRAVQWLEKQRR